MFFIEGLGRAKTATGEAGPVVHHARGVLSFDEKTSKYRFHSWRTPGGMYLEVEPVVSDNGFQWTMKTPRGTMRYTMTLTQDGAWDEIGEFSADGQTWRPFFKMLLRRKG